MKIKKINDVVIKPIKFQKPNLKIKGYDMFPEVYSNIGIISKKKSGKTTIIYRILQKCLGRDTKVYIFASTVHRDNSYKKIIEFLDNKKIDYELFTSIVENKINNVEQILNDLKQDESETDTTDTDSETENVRLLDYDDGHEEEQKPRKPKYLAPEVVFIFDDLGVGMRDRIIGTLLKTNRHYKSKIIISTQHLNDLQPESRMNLDYILLFKGLPILKLEQIYKDVDLSVDYNKYIKMYELATEEKYNFFYIDIRNEKFRKNFNLQIDEE